MSAKGKKPFVVQAAGLALVRGGSKADIDRLISLGGRVLASGENISVKEWRGLTLHSPYILVALGRLRVLIVHEKTRISPKR